ncbi:MAG TPA: hypothetical protein VFO35_07920, partial [Steroidobacteraceae bacterium]|nr:hypothetical protein [Steroidobacteraceae bacterium]
MSERAPMSTCSPFAVSEREVAVLAKYGLASRGAVSLARTAALLIAATWAPLFILTLSAGTAFGAAVQMTFLADHLPHGRYLLGLPLLLWMNQVVERRTALAIWHVRNSNLIVREYEEHFTHIVAAATRASRSKVVLLALVVMTYVSAVSSLLVLRDSMSFTSWMFDGRHLSAAGVWNTFVSAALMRLLVLRSFWKLAVWMWWLIRLSRLPLQLDALHPDGRCGLRFLGETQLAFCPLIAALGLQLGCLVADAVRF